MNVVVDRWVDYPENIAPIVLGEKCTARVHPNVELQKVRDAIGRDSVAAMWRYKPSLRCLHVFNSVVLVGLMEKINLINNNNQENPMTNHTFEETNHTKN